MKLSDQQLAQYCARIGYSGPLDADLATLQALHLHHPNHIAFENLNSWLALEVSLEPQQVFNKLVLQGRGGYCFEHNLLLMKVLETLGFQVQGLAARVLWNMPADARPPRTHQALLVTIDSRPYLADVGFGGLTPLCPLQLQIDLPQTSPRETFELSQNAHGYQLDAWLGQDRRPMYSFTLEPASPADYAQGNWFVSTYPQSRFVEHLIAAFIKDNTRHNLMNTQYTVYPEAGPSLTREIPDAATLRALLEDTFGLTLKELPGLDARLKTLFAPESRT